MPFIRYNIRDIGILSDKQCPCGRGLPLLERIEGRTDDLIQESEDEFLLQMVKGKDFSQETIEKVKEELKKILGASAHLKVQILDEIPIDSSGKSRSVISKVKS